MPPYDWNWEWLAGDEGDFRDWSAAQALPSIAFSAITDIAAPPSNNTVQAGAFYRVMRHRQPKWALFLCPCGCREVVTLSLQAVHRPHWRVRSSEQQRPSLRPSVWRDVGCRSHFWIEDGRVYWCRETDVRWGGR
jgi:hypothetical protein